MVFIKKIKSPTREFKINILFYVFYLAIKSALFHHKLIADPHFLRAQNIISA